MKEPEVELERYELLEGAPYRFNVPRRSFLGVLGTGLVVLWLPRRATAQPSGEPPPPAEIGAWLHIGGDGNVTVFTGKVEFGQDIRTSLTQVVAEELRAPLGSIRLVMGDTDLVPFDMGTFGSRTTPTMAPQLRKVAAAARETLLDLAAAQWSVDRTELVVEAGRVAHEASKRTAGFGALTRGEKLVKAVSEAPTTPAARWTVAGQSIPKVNGRDLVTGRHEYTSDIKRPGMLYGKVLRPPALGATPTTVDLEPAKGEGIVVVRDGDFIGVVAPSARRASKARDAVKVEWSRTPQPKRETLFADLKAKAQPANDQGSHSAGSTAEAFSAAHKTLERSYAVAYIAHVPLEPRAAVAEWKDGALTAWTGTQRPFGVRTQLAEAFHLPPEKVRVIVPDTGSGYGGKHTGEAAIEAARLAKAAGKPVKLVWTREEEFAWAYFRPAGVIDVKSAVAADGRITAWELHNYNSGSAGIRTPYDVPNQTIQFHPSDSPWRQGSYRGLAATANHFAREMHMDELAAELKKDPLEFRRANLKDERLRAVLDAAAQRFGWGRAKPGTNRGFGIAGGHEKGSYVATCAEVEIERPSGRVRVVRLVAAFECGAILNPAHLESQVQGCLVQGLGGALFEAIDYADGRIANGRLSAYRVPRFSDTPEIDVVLLDRKDLPSVGAGETPIVAVAPAVGGAIFDATGARLRSLPLAPDGAKV